MKHRPLHHRLFAWFGASILLTALAAGASFAVVAHFSESEWKQDFERVRTFAGHVFAERWEDPAERDRLAQMVATDLNVEVILEDERGTVLSSHGPRCRSKNQWTLAVTREGDRLGTARFCANRRSGGPWKVLIPLFVLGAILWAASHRISRRLARPLREVARVAREIGDGNLQARPRVGRHAPMEVLTLTRSIEDMASRIQRQLDDQRVLLAAVSHELRTPLGHLRILAELARSGDENLPKVLADIETEVSEIDELVGQLLAGARLDFTEIDAQEMDAADAVRRALQRKGLPEEKADVEEARFTGDPTLVSRALANLVDNAERHGKGLVTLCARTDGDELIFEAEDTGPGIPAAEREKLFELFRTGTREHGNLGLGLALVRRIAEAHGGRAFAENRPEGGARIGFTVRRKA